MHDLVPRLRDLLPYTEVVVGAPAAPGWVRLDRALADGRIGPWLATVEANAGRRDAATSFFGSWLAAPVVMASAAAVLLGSRAPDMRPDTVHLRPHADGWFDGVAFSGGTSGEITSPTPSLTTTTTTTTGRAAVHRHWADGVAATLTPLLDEVSRVGRFGRRGLWGVGVVDRAMSIATTISWHDPARSDRTLAEAEALLEALGRCAPVPLPPARLFPVDWRGDVVQFEVKSSCCLAYKTVPACDRRTENYCTGCPLVRDDTRPPRWTTWLEQVSAPAAAEPVSS